MRQGVTKGEDLICPLTSSRFGAAASLVNAKRGGFAEHRYEYEVRTVVIAIASDLTQSGIENALDALRRYVARRSWARRRFAS